MQHRNNYCNEDITGYRFGRLVAIEKATNTKSQWVFQCDCGNTIVLPISRVFGGTQSCGCLRKEIGQQWAQARTKHGQCSTKLYRKYRAMLDRCYYSASWKYKRYGGRGIYVCDEWKNSFITFAEWAYKTGYDPNLNGRIEQSLERIDNDGPYSPENCRWATAKEQQKNRACTTLYPYKGEMYSASEFADKFGIKDKSFVYRRLLKNGQTLEYILADWERIHNVPKHLREVSEYAKMRGITQATVRRWLCKKRIAGEKIGRKWYVDISEFAKEGK